MNLNAPTVSSSAGNSETETSEQKQLMEQYKIYVDTIGNSAEDRLKTNQFFMTINSFLATLFSTIAGYMFVSGKGHMLLLVPLSIMGYGVSRVWYFFLKNYTTANSAKWDAVYKLEEKLPNKPFLSEWEDGLGKIYATDMPKGFSWLSGNTPNKYYSTSRVESELPTLFGKMYIALGVITVALWGYKSEWLHSKGSDILNFVKEIWTWGWIGIVILIIIALIIAFVVWLIWLIATNNDAKQA